jgi:hypothetical protein
MKRLDAFSEGLFIGVLFLVVIALMLIGLSFTHAQDNPPPFTIFTPGCVEQLGDIHYRIHFGYQSDGVEPFTVQFGNTNNGSAVINTPEHFVTSPGLHDDWYLDAHAEDSPYVFTVTFSGALTTTLELHTWDTKPCADGQYGVYVPATPEPVLGDCPAWSYDSTAHTLKCLWDLPKAGAYQ